MNRNQLETFEKPTGIFVLPPTSTTQQYTTASTTDSVDQNPAAHTKHVISTTRHVRHTNGKTHTQKKVNVSTAL